MKFSVIKRDLFPVIKYDKKHPGFELDPLKESVTAYIDSLVQLDKGEKEYLKAFSKKEYRPELLFDDGAILERIRNHPMALWKCR